MSLIVQKYGGSSVGDPERILNVARRISVTRQEGHKVVAVVSAMGGVTDSLIRLARQICPAPPEREMDVLLATGEQTTIALTAMALHTLGQQAVSLTGAQAGIITDGVHTKAKIANITPRQVHEHLNNGEIVIIAGFQGETTDGRITTLGRGGSDLTAPAVPAAASARNSVFGVRYPAISTKARSSRSLLPTRCTEACCGSGNSWRSHCPASKLNATALPWTLR